MRRETFPAPMSADHDDERPGGWIRAALEQHERALVLYAARLLRGDVERARDLVQEAFLRLCNQKRAEVEGRSAEWLYAVCRNLALDARRKETRMSTLSEEQAAHTPGGGPRPGEALEREDTLAHVLTILGRLPEKQQEVLRLKFQHGLSYKEISRVTEESLGNVGWLIHTGIRKLREELSAEQPKGARA
jgi:RNA polymerase sigma-70 factor (ECF subfamily)